MSLPVEEKVIQKIRDILNADTTIDRYVQTRIYLSHISSVQQPKYPAISLFPLNSRSVFALPGMVEVRIQIDFWILAAYSSGTEYMDVHQKMRELLQRQNLVDATIPLSVGAIFETNCGPLMYEQDTGLYHYPVEYVITAA